MKQNLLVIGKGLQRAGLSMGALIIIFSVISMTFFDVGNGVGIVLLVGLGIPLALLLWCVGYICHRFGN